MSFDSLLARVDRQQLRRLVACAERALVQAKDLDGSMVQMARARAESACLCDCNPLVASPMSANRFPNNAFAQVTLAINTALPTWIPTSFKQPMLQLLRGLANSDPQRRGGLERRAKTTVALHILTGWVRRHESAIQIPFLSFTRASIHGLCFACSMVGSCEPIPAFLRPLFTLVQRVVEAQVLADMSPRVIDCGDVATCCVCP